MLAYGHNGTISMDATFGTNDVKYLLFTLMGFDVHHTRNASSMDHYKSTNYE
jgi:hypothetical protein